MMFYILVLLFFFYSSVLVIAYSLWLLVLLMASYYSLYVKPNLTRATLIAVRLFPIFLLTAELIFLNTYPIYMCVSTGLAASKGVSCFAELLQ